MRLAITHVASLALTLLFAMPYAYAQTSGDDPWPQLLTYYSKNGQLNVTLEAKPQTINLGDVSFDGATYNGSYGAPVLHLKPGDTLHVHLINHLKETTNLHFHGIHTSPKNNSDNIFTVVQPNQVFDYEVKISPTQPPGLYWYHSHIHGQTEMQTMRGLSGALIVDPTTPDAVPMRERLLVLKDYTFETAPNDIVKTYYHKFVQTISGQTNVTLQMHPHEKQLLRLTNQSADNTSRLSITGHAFYVVARDGVRLGTPTTETTLNLPPASRADAILDAGDAGQYSIIANGVVTGSGDTKTTDRIMGQVIVAGDAVDSPPLPAGVPRPDLSNAKIDAERSVVFSQSKDGTQYLLNGKIFDHDRIDIRVPLGSTEKWTIKNDTDDLHVFHIHQMHFQVVEINGVPQTDHVYLDNVRIPERGEVKIIIPFTESIILGKFVYHCHVLEHEDKGMMGVIQVYDPHHFDFGEWVDDMWGRICTTMGWKHTALTLFTKAAPVGTPEPRLDGHFDLFDQNGQPVTEKTYEGKYRLIFFGYTHCPDACPTALATLDKTLQTLTDKGRNISIQFVSLDPERDTAPVLKSYLGNFATPMTGLTGTLEQVNRFSKNMNIQFEKVADKDVDGGYSIDHPAAVYLMDKQGNYVDDLSYQATPEEFIAFLKKYGATP